MFEFDLGLEKGNYFLSKYAFNYDLSICDIRVLLLLSSKEGITINSFDHRCKRWCYKKNSYTNSIFKESERKLIEFGLINKDGTGLNLEKDYIIFRSIEEVTNCKTIKQIFILALKYWNTKHKNAIISTSVFYKIFPNKRAFQRACESVGLLFSYTEKYNKIFVFREKVDLKTEETSSSKNKSKGKVDIKLLTNIKSKYSDTPIPEPSVDVSKLDFDDTDYDRFSVVGENIQ